MGWDCLYQNVALTQLPLPSPDLLGVSPCVCHEAAGIGPDRLPPGMGVQRPEKGRLCLYDLQRGLELVSGWQRSVCSPWVCRVCACLVLL